jgi:hypothetical protein
LWWRPSLFRVEDEPEAVRPLPEHPARFSGRGLTGCLWLAAHFF